jgi:16S rRNA (guanine527-N7)-methyltransferase
MTPDRFRALVAARAANASVSIADEAFPQLDAYFRLLVLWNRTINLTALPLDPPTDRTIDRLLIEPLVGAELVGDFSGPWFDVGSGGGSPAIPFKIVRPEARLTMIESKTRKAAFLREAVRTLGLIDADVVNERFDAAAELFTPHSVALVTVRAVRSGGPLLATIYHLLEQQGRALFFHSANAGLEVQRPFRILSTIPAGTGEDDQLSLIQTMFHVEQTG